MRADTSNQMTDAAGRPTGFSVIMPAYNAERTITKAIASIRHQSYTNWELIIVDDGSTDGTTNIVRDLASHDPRIRLIAQPHSGRPSISRNKGIEASSAAWLTFLDADDHWTKDRLHHCHTAAAAVPESTMIFHDMFLEDENGSRHDQTYLRSADFHIRSQPFVTQKRDSIWHLAPRFYVFMCLYYAAAHTNSICVKRTTSPPHGLRFSTDLTVGEDTDLWIRIAEVASIVYVDMPLATYTLHDRGVSSRASVFARDSLNLHRVNYRRLRARLTASERWKYREKISEYAMHKAYQHLSATENLQAAHDYALSFLYKPTRRSILGLLKTPFPWNRFRNFLNERKHR